MPKKIIHQRATIEEQARIGEVRRYEGGALVNGDIISFEVFAIYKSEFNGDSRTLYSDDCDEHEYSLRLLDVNNLKYWALIK